jgi:glycerophosphoryl diester phosphodiesterase
LTVGEPTGSADGRAGGFSWRRVEWPTVNTIAHRGFAGTAPENTVRAAERAVAAGADGIECDVRATADGTPVVFHDDHLGPEDRGVTDRTGAVHASATDHVTGARVLGTAATVPTLAAFAAAVPPACTFHVELKRPSAGSLVVGPLDDATRDDRRAAWAPFVDRVRAALRDRDGPVVYSSFHEGALAAVRAADPDAALAPLAVGVDDAVRMADHLDAATIHPSLEGLGAADAPDDRAVNAWTARTWQDARDAARAGADGIIADYPGLWDGSAE